MRFMPILVAGLILLAGCSGSTKTDSKGDDFNVDGEEEIDLGGFGAITGRVHDVGNRSIRGVAIHVLADEQLQGKTDRDGEFRIDGIIPGEYKIHVFHEVYAAKAFDVVIQANKVLRLSIELRLLQELCGACSPHVHDHWRGETSVRVMDSLNDFRERPGSSTVIPQLVYAYGTVFHPNFNGSAGVNIIGNLYPLHFEGGDDSRPPIILPGTGAYELTLSWDETQIQTDELGLYVVPMGNSSHDYWIPAVKNGQTITRPVPVDLNDNGHQPWTFWQIYYYFPNHVTQAPDYDPMVNLGPVRAELDVIKGEEPYLEPGHEELWGDRTEYVFAHDSWGRSTSLTHPAGEEMNRLHEEGMLVYPGADRMIIEFTWKEGANRDTLGSHILRWRTGEQNPMTTNVWDFKTADPTDCGAQCHIYEIDLSNEETDQYYYKDSNWRFYAYPEFTEEHGAYSDGELQYTAKVTVYKDD